MSLLTPALRGKMGNTEYYISRMSARELVQGVRPAHMLDNWHELTLEERMQREADQNRVIKDIAPYLAESPDRFFGSIIVLVYKGVIHFESLGKDLKISVPYAYKSQADHIGFLTIDGGDLIVLDGQHRWLAFQKVIQGDIKGPFSADVSQDEVSVIFLNHDDNEKTRRIFNRVNRYAKQTSRGDNLITSEDDGFAIITRRLITDYDAPFKVQDKDGKDVELINWKSNTLSQRSTSLTTISALYEMNKAVLKASPTLYREIEPKQNTVRPTDATLEAAFSRVKEFWELAITRIDAFQRAIDDTASIPSFRDSEHKYSLLFKPASQIAFIQAIMFAQESTMYTFEELFTQVNKINWSMQEEVWKDVIVNRNGTINANAEARDRTTKLMSYLLAGDKMEEKTLYSILKSYNEAKGHKINDSSEAKYDLPILEK